MEILNNDDANNIRSKFCQRDKKMTELIIKILGRNGLIGKVLPGSEHRTAQVDMSSIVGQVLLRQKQTAIVEAPTGSGKSLAYSIPAVIASLMMNQPILLSTSTKNLQGQLIEKDLPLLKQVFEQYLNLQFEYTVCQGRSNYLCLRRLHRMLEIQSSTKKKRRNKKYEELQMEDSIEEVPESLVVAIQRKKVRENLKTESERHSFDILMDWYISEPKIGDVREFGIEVGKGAMAGLWEKVCSSSDDCMSWKCAYQKHCYFAKSKKEWENANICVINHALFFANQTVIANGGNSIIPISQCIVFDEADHVQTVAQGFYGLEIHSTWARRLIERVLPHIDEKGCLHDIFGTPSLQRQFMQQAELFAETSKVFFESLTSHYLNDGKHIKRYKETIAVDASSVVNKLTEFTELFERAHRLYEAVDKDRASEANSFRNSFQRYKDNLINLAINVDCNENCYFIEMGHEASRYGKKISLKSVPIDASKSIRKATKGLHCVYTSATLAANNALEYFGSTIGVNPNDSDVLTAILPSPFDFQDNCVVYQPKMPATNSPEYDSAIAQEILQIEPNINGGIFVLFTAYTSMMNVVDQIRPLLESQRGRRVFVQGIDGAKDKMIEQFRSDTKAILFGVSSFWVGVDVRGSALSCVIITKMPFERPDEPINEAMKEFLEQHNRSYFKDYDLPKATMMIRQGFGRLIRTSSDYGTIVLLDPRLNKDGIHHKFYADSVMKSLPQCNVTGNIKEVQNFLKKRSKK